ncbi:hypothetical protein TrVE_jg9263 [Triparma verrucosa]|uniref:Uncharacterized protein n=1 Tax=Triparma verrucosa TaxID=1606542 RepID=A0A9W7BJ55_9STRA|nr:hypothetical protein TrVE_jg9263 [Triparma verrucosa]
MSSLLFPLISPLLPSFLSTYILPSTDGRLILKVGGFTITILGLELNGEGEGFKLLKTILKVLKSDYDVTSTILQTPNQPPTLTITAVNVDYVFTPPNAPPPLQSYTNLHSAVLKHLLKIFLSLTVSIKTLSLKLQSYLEDPRVETQTSHFEGSSVKISLETITCVKVTFISVDSDKDITAKYITAFLYLEEEYDNITDVEVEVDSINFTNDLSLYLSFLSNNYPPPPPPTFPPPNPQNQIKPKTKYKLKVSSLQTTAFKLIELDISVDRQMSFSIKFHFSLNHRYGFFDHDLTVHYIPASSSLSLKSSSDAGWRVTGFRVEWFLPPGGGWREGNEKNAPPQSKQVNADHANLDAPSSRSFDEIIHKLTSLTSDLKSQTDSHSSSLKSLKSLLSKNEEQRVALSSLTSCTIEGYLILGRGMNFNPKAACMHRFRPPYLIRYDGVTAAEFLNLELCALTKLTKKGKDIGFQITHLQPDLKDNKPIYKPLIGSSDAWVEIISRFLTANRQKNSGSEHVINDNTDAAEKKSNRKSTFPKMTWKKKNTKPSFPPTAPPLPPPLTLPVPSKLCRVAISRNPPTPTSYSPPTSASSQHTSFSNKFTSITFTLTLDAPPHLHTLTRSLGQFLHFSHEVLDSLPRSDLHLGKTFDTATGDSPIVETITTAKQCSTAATVPEEDGRVEILANFIETVLRHDIEEIRGEMWKFLGCGFAPSAPAVEGADSKLKIVYDSFEEDNSDNEDALMEVIRDVVRLSSEVVAANNSYVKKIISLEEKLESQSIQHAKTIQKLSDLQPIMTTVASPYDKTLLDRLKTTLTELTSAKQSIAAESSKDSEKVQILERRLAAMTERYTSSVDGVKVEANEEHLTSTFSESDMNLMLKQLQGEILERTKVHLELSMIRELEVIEKERDERERRRRENDIQTLKAEVKEERERRIKAEALLNDQN